jgi:hypothetical protein
MLPYLIGNHIYIYFNSSWFIFVHFFCWDSDEWICRMVANTRCQIFECRTKTFARYWFKFLNKHHNRLHQNLHIFSSTTIVILDKGWGLYATRDVRDGEILISVPDSTIIRASTVKSQLPYSQLCSRYWNIYTVYLDKNMLQTSIIDSIRNSGVILLYRRCTTRIIDMVTIFAYITARLFNPRRSTARYGCTSIARIITRILA